MRHHPEVPLREREETETDHHREDDDGQAPVADAVVDTPQEPREAARDEREHAEVHDLGEVVASGLERVGVLGPEVGERLPRVAGAGVQSDGGVDQAGHEEAAVLFAVHLEGRLAHPAVLGGLADGRERLDEVDVLDTGEVDGAAVRVGALFEVAAHLALHLTAVVRAEARGDLG